MSWQHDPITDLDLMAYADGQLDAVRRQTVEAHLAATPADARVVEAIMAQNAVLRTTLGPIAEEPVPQRLKGVLEREPRPLLVPALKAASIVALALVSGLGGWWLGGADGRSSAPPPAFLAALPLEPPLATQDRIEATGAVAAVADETIDTPPWLPETVSLKLAAPGLAAGFSSPELHRLVDGDGRPTLRFRLAGPEGRVLSLYLQSRSPAEAPTVRLVEAGQAPHPGPAAYWRDGALVWALTGDAEGAELVALAERIAQAIEFEPRLGPPDAEHTRRDREAGAVQLTADDGQPPAMLPALPEVPIPQPPIELAGG